MADTIRIPMTLMQYVAARKALSSASGVGHSPTSTTEGTVTSSQLDFRYSYDGGAMLTLSDLQRHSFKAKLASDAQIKSHIMELLA